MTARSDKEFVLVGKVVKPHGIRGEFCIKSFADSPFLFDEIKRIFLREGKRRPQPVTVQSWRMHKGMVLMTVNQVADRNRSEELRGAEVLVRAADLPDIGEDEFYLHEVEGFNVVLENGTVVGRFKGFIEAPGHDVWAIATPAKKEILLPAVPEFILDVDMEGETIVIDPPEGLIDLYENPEPPKKKNPAPRRTNKKKPSSK
ncbi:ribosome maturation factor RimM [Salidesulfovibrio onnuriiensis]|uniref:ribosome maturation factor RimM n=1 Tax=Salidesulfovibrio onnuriiensis TaxID=2583823 RepID=UPI0011CBCB71|nr:ribosome maturation factor RimM [Salidesulfovibrio onnuriiensis]